MLLYVCTQWLQDEWKRKIQKDILGVLWFASDNIYILTLFDISVLFITPPGYELVSIRSSVRISDLSSVLNLAEAVTQQPQIRSKSRSLGLSWPADVEHHGQSPIGHIGAASKMWSQDMQTRRCDLATGLLHPNLSSPGFTRPPKMNTVVI